jgi:hypothetical protein
MNITLKNEIENIALALGMISLFGESVYVTDLSKKGQFLK